MTNKKICLALVVAALVCGIILPACKDEPSFDASDLVGKWNTDEGMYIEFKAGGKIAGYDGEDSGTYSTSGSTLTLTGDGESISGTFKFDGRDTLILSEFGEETDLDGTYTRIK